MSSSYFSAGHHSLWEQSGLSGRARLDGATQDFSAQADAGEDGEADVREAPDDPGHAGAPQPNDARPRVLSSRNQGNKTTPSSKDNTVNQCWFI